MSSLFLFNSSRGRIMQQLSNYFKSKWSTGIIYKSLNFKMMTGVYRSSDAIFVSLETAIISMVTAMLYPGKAQFVTNQSDYFINAML